MSVMFQEVDDNMEHKVLKEKLKLVISSNDLSCSQKLNFISWVQRLGVSYHFQHEIEEALAKIHSIYSSNNNLIITHDEDDDNLHSLALLFRLLRQHGYPISSDVFERFKDINGKFDNENLTQNDVEGMLAWYEAAQLEHLYQKELGNVTKWWKELDTKRMIAAKLISILVVLDDTYDVYGTPEELELFTEAIRRWGISPIESLPECMKTMFEAVVELCSEMEMVTAKEGTSNFVMPHVKQAFINLAEAYLMEAKWCSEKYVPSYEEDKDNGHVSVTSPLQITSFLGLLGNLATKEVSDWISTNQKIVNVSLIGRLLDDMATHKFEQGREHVASAVECCMKQFGVSEEEAHQIIKDDIKNCWKDVNEECLNNPHDVPRSVLDCVVNLARVFEVVYENRQNGFNTNDSFKHHIVQLLLDPITIGP
ncbi:hypothetical protein K1719_034972 [Acacia pycnantha]|nr:hypothetical protein K1719_034972 [Acacia pycnantha]